MNEAEASVLDPYRPPADDFEPNPGLPRQYLGLAGILGRFAALLIDYVVLMVVGLGVGLVIERVGIQAQMSEPEIAGLKAMAWLILCALYFAAFESAGPQGTLGKMALGIRVTDRRGRPIGFARALLRFFGKLLGLLLLGIGFMITPFLPKRQALHDLIAGTLVLKVR